MKVAFNGIFQPKHPGFGISVKCLLNNSIKKKYPEMKKHFLKSILITKGGFLC